MHTIFVTFFNQNLVISTILFLIVLVAGGGLFLFQLLRVRKNIQLGRPDDRSDQPTARFRQMLLVAFGQQKMFKRWVPALLHGIVYVSFIVINIEVLEIVIDGIFGTHRVLGALGPVYSVLIWVNEWLAALVIVACSILLIRRYVLKLKRFRGQEMAESKGLIRIRNYSHIDASIILWTEIILMLALFAFNIADISLHQLSSEALVGTFPISQGLADMQLFGTNETTLHLIERTGWWGHIIGILAFLNFLPISKHFHVLMAFPNVYYSNTGLKPKGELNNLSQVQEEMKAILDESYTPQESPDDPKRFGAKDVTDLSWKSLMDAYTCTECGRCTAVCPANITGKKLSPRKVVMDVRDRLEEIQKFKLVPGEDGLMQPSSEIEGAQEAASHTLLGDFYITEEELHACTTCNACVEECPVNIDQVSIIVDLRRHLIMEDSQMPEEWAIMSNNIENSGNPWGMPDASRFDWKN